ncbi:MAG: HEPN domain-containing protein [Bacteroidales bacterium]
MKTKAEHIAYWTEQALDDWEAVDTLFRGKKYLQSLFYTHLVIEKLCKALWIKYNETNIPPKTHNLIYILSQTTIVLPEDKSELMLNLNRFQLEGRYPEYITKMLNICNEKFTKEKIEQANHLRLWLIEKQQ